MRHPLRAPPDPLKVQVTVVNRIFQVFQKSEIEIFVLSRAKSCNFITTTRILMFLSAGKCITKVLERLRGRLDPLEQDNQ